MGDDASVISLSSNQSMRKSLESISNGSGGLDRHRQSILGRVPNIGDWSSFGLNTLSMKDLAYLTAKTNHEFAILRGKKEDILFHGDSTKCTFTGALADMIMEKKLSLYGHSHPGEEVPVPSPQDRETLKIIGQTSSKLISGLTGYEIEFTADPFEI